MKPRSNTPVLIAVIIVALGGMVVLNRIQYDSRPRSTAELQQEAEEQAARAQAEGKPAAAAAPAATQAQAEVNLPTKEEFGVPKEGAEHTIVLGYEWTPEVQADPQKASKDLATFRSRLEQMNAGMSKKVHFQLVNVDVQREQKPGVWLDGRQIGELNVGTLERSGAHLGESIMRQLQAPSLPPNGSQSTKS